MALDLRALKTTKATFWKTWCQTPCMKLRSRPRIALAGVQFRTNSNFTPGHTVSFNLSDRDRGKANEMLGTNNVEATKEKTPDVWTQRSGRSRQFWTNFVNCNLVVFKGVPLSLYNGSSCVFQRKSCCLKNFKRKKRLLTFLGWFFSENKIETTLFMTCNVLGIWNARQFHFSRKIAEHGQFYAPNCKISPPHLCNGLFRQSWSLWHNNHDKEDLVSSPSNIVK